MKCSFFLSLLVGALLLVYACNDGKGNDSGQPKKNEHTSHQKEQSVKENTHEGMVMPGDKKTDSSLLSVVAAANEVVLSDQASVPVRLTDTTVRVKGYGYVTWDIRRNRRIAARTGGRVERLFVKYNYQYVQKGQKILELYTPEINTYAAEYLHHYATPGDEELLVRAREKLMLLGLTKQQLKALEQTGRIANTLSVFSNASGYALFDAGNAPMASGMNSTPSSQGGDMSGGMSSGNNPAQTSFEGASPASRLREGMYVNRGQTLFYVNDFAVAWGVLSFDETTQPLLRKGMNVVLKSELLDLPVRSTISFIEPSFNSASQKFMQVRTYLRNTGHRLKINSLIEGTVDIPLQGQLIIPADAVFSLGKRKVVWVKTGTTPSGKNIFKVRDIKLSLLDKKIAVVTAGLSANEEVAANAGYLLDSQSIIEQ